MRYLTLIMCALIFQKCVSAELINSCIDRKNYNGEWINTLAKKTDFDPYLIKPSIMLEASNEDLSHILIATPLRVRYERIEAKNDGFSVKFFTDYEVTIGIKINNTQLSSCIIAV